MKLRFDGGRMKYLAGVINIYCIYPRLQVILSKKFNRHIQIPSVHIKTVFPKFQLELGLE